jgi:hypothetical protein
MLVGTFGQNKLIEDAVVTRGKPPIKLGETNKISEQVLDFVALDVVNWDIKLASVANQRVIRERIC